MKMLLVVSMSFLLGVGACFGAEDFQADTDQETGGNAFPDVGPAGERAEAPMTPVAELQSPSGSQILFFVGEDQGVDVVEVGDATNSSVIEHPELRGATALDIFHAVSEPGTAVPSELVAATFEKSEKLINTHGLMDRKQGWLLDAAVEFEAAAPAECASDAAFTAGYCTGTHHCALNQTTALHYEDGPVLGYRGGVCNRSGSTYAELWYRSQPVGQCGALGPWHRIAGLTLKSGGWIKHVEPDTFPGRRYYIGKGSGGKADIGHSYSAARCVQ